MVNRTSRQTSAPVCVLGLGEGRFWRRLRAAATAAIERADAPLALVITAADAPTASLRAAGPEVVVAVAPGPEADPGAPVVRLGAGDFRGPEPAARVATDPLALGARAVRHLAAQHAARLHLVGLTGLVARGASVTAGTLGLSCLPTAPPAHAADAGLLLGTGPAARRLLAAAATGVTALPPRSLLVRDEGGSGPEPEGLPVLGPDPVLLAEAVVATALAVADGRRFPRPVRVPPAAAPTLVGRLQGEHERRLATALDFIGAHHAEDLSVAEVARATGLSLRHLQRLFAVHLGHGPLAEIHRVRVERSLDLLWDRRRSVAEVARTVGFAEADRFTAAFRRHLGTTPGRWRAHRG